MSASKDKTFELFECTVCLEHIIPKEPRLLNCGHTFCTPCLTELVKHNQISCPKCRGNTIVPQVGVSALPKNTELREMYDREKQITTGKICQICKTNHEVKYICISCSNKLICEKCANKHKIIKAFQDHNVVVISKEQHGAVALDRCLEHSESLDFFCVECDMPLCCVCTCDPSHEDHPDKILDLDIYISHINKETEKSKRELLKLSGITKLCTDKIQAEICSVGVIKESIKAKSEELSILLNELKEKDAVIAVTERHMGIDFKHFQECNTKITKLKEAIDDSKKIKSKVDFIKRAKECNDELRKINNELSELMNSEIVITKYSPENLKIKGSLGEFKELKSSLESLVLRQKPKTRQGYFEDNSSYAVFPDTGPPIQKRK